MLKNLPFVLGGLLVGIFSAVIFSTSIVNSENSSMMRLVGMHTHDDPVESHMAGSMNDMMYGLDNTLDFDKSFLSEMIIHHQGAINMAQKAKAEGQHNEIKKMADDIITNQTKEIEQMKQWQKDWDYTSP